jgi:hypothetical protein
MNAYPKAPDLQELIALHGGYDKITPEAWRRFDAAMSAWHHARRIHTVSYVDDLPTKPRKRRTERGRT